VGSGRAVLAKRAKARGPRRGVKLRVPWAAERNGMEAARRGLSRGRQYGGLGKRFGRPVRGAAAELQRFYGLFEQKFLIRQRLRTIVITLVAAWAAWTFVIGDAGILRLLHVKNQNAKLMPEIEALKRQERELRVEVRALVNADDKTVEHVAREQHALVKDGEVLVRFYEGDEEKK
jgi:cell division protein FtsB